MIASSSFQGQGTKRKNRYAAYAKLQEEQLRELSGRFARGDSASLASKSMAVNRNTVNRYYQMFREALSQGAPAALKVSPKKSPVVGLFLSSRGVDPRIVAEEHRHTALTCLRQPGNALEACASPGWPGYDALGDPATGMFTIMPGCLVGAYGQMLLTTYWQKLRARLCASRGISREAYWQHLVVFDQLERQGAERFQENLLRRLESAS